jgi:hypothetical protein
MSRLAHRPPLLGLNSKTYVLRVRKFRNNLILPLQFQSPLCSNFLRISDNLKEIFSKQSFSACYSKEAGAKLVRLVNNSFRFFSAHFVRGCGFSCRRAVYTVVVAGKCASPRQNIQRSISLQSLSKPQIVIQLFRTLCHLLFKPGKGSRRCSRRKPQATRWLWCTSLSSRCNGTEQPALVSLC